MSKQWRVLISSSHNVYTNLAWEDWLYRNANFSEQSLLLLWRNNPCVVMGRYQNPWKEVNLSALKLLNVHLVRRHSGGGTVYHDLGNLNFSFMTDRKSHNRRKNLEFIVAGLQKEYQIPAKVSKRDDIVVNDTLKVSGTAAKLGRNAAYHHCTLLCSVKKEHLRKVLSPEKVGIQTNATESIPSPTVNLAEISPKVTCEALTVLFSEEYASFNEEKGNYVQVISPNENDYPGLSSSAAELNSEEFIFGKTPNFSIVREFLLPANSPPAAKFSIVTHVEKGATAESTITGNLSESVMDNARKNLNALKGVPFGDTAAKWLSFSSGATDDKNVTDGSKLERDFVYHCIVRALSRT